MKAIKAQFEGGQIKLSEPAPDAGPVEVLVVFPEAADDPWETILKDPAPRPELVKAAAEIRAEIAAGQSQPLKLDDL
ncbi:MAG TPA: hypothetical protein VL475_06050 [Planctomycetaceae bacterium]|nr:hypothetical protein [Planctomycetaceae bacterium]